MDADEALRARQTRVANSCKQPRSVGRQDRGRFQARSDVGVELPLDFGAFSTMASDHQIIIGLSIASSRRGIRRSIAACTCAA